MCFCCVREPKNQHQPENATKGRTTQGECNPKLAPAGEPGTFTSRDVGLCLFAAVDLSAGPTTSSTFQTRQPTIHPLASAIDMPVIEAEIHVASITKRGVLGVRTPAEHIAILHRVGFTVRVRQRNPALNIDSGRTLILRVLGDDHQRLQIRFLHGTLWIQARQTARRAFVNDLGGRRHLGRSLRRGDLRPRIPSGSVTKPGVSAAPIVAHPQLGAFHNVDTFGIRLVIGRFRTRKVHLMMRTVTKRLVMRQSAAAQGVSFALGQGATRILGVARPIGMNPRFSQRYPAGHQVGPARADFDSHSLC